jgi:hypothetical protein
MKVLVMTSGDIVRCQLFIVLGSKMLFHLRWQKYVPELAIEIVL